MADTVLTYLMDTCAGWPAEFSLFKWEHRARMEMPVKGQVPSQAAELQRDPARADAEAVFACSLLMKLGGWEKYRVAYEELGKIIAHGLSMAADMGSGPLAPQSVKGKGSNTIPAAETERLVERERRLLPRFEALYLRGVCGLQLVGAADAAGTLKTPVVAPGGSSLREHPPLALQPLKKDVKAKQREQQAYWNLAAADLETYVREAGPDAKVSLTSWQFPPSQGLISCRCPIERRRRTLSRGLPSPRSRP
jgi:hypothetical protein